MAIEGLHHVTAITADAPGNVESLKTVLLDGLSAGQKAKVSTGSGQ